MEKTNSIKGFVKSAQVAEILTAGYKSGQNVILYGPGGYGKSEMTTQFLRQIGARKDQVTVKSLSVGTSVDDLFGGINMKVLKKEGKIQYNLEDSVFSTPYLVLEEAFDAPLRVLESLKDTLTSGWVRNGAQQWKVQTKFIIVCTNRSKSELIEDESSKALMERFPLSLEVKWESHTLLDYKNLVNKVFGECPKTVSALLKYMLESISEDPSKQPPSPRTVVRMVQVFQAAGLNALKYMDGLPNIDRAIENLHEIVRIAEKRKKHAELFLSLEEEKEAFSATTSYGEIQDFTRRVQELRFFNDVIENNEIEKQIEQLTDITSMFV